MRASHLPRPRCGGGGTRTSTTPRIVSAAVVAWVVPRTSHSDDMEELLLQEDPFHGLYEHETDVADVKDVGQQVCRRWVRTSAEGIALHSG